MGGLVRERTDTVAGAMRRAFAPAPIRRGFIVVAGARPVGVVVADSRRGLSAAACRLCGIATYDRTLPLAARWLAQHLAGAHAVERPEVDVSHAGRGSAARAAARQIGAAFVTQGRKVAA